MPQYNRHIMGSICLIAIVLGLAIAVIPTQGQQLACEAIALERNVATPADMLSIMGASPLMTDLTITAVTVDMETNVPLLIATDPQPFVFSQRLSLPIRLILVIHLPRSRYSPQVLSTCVQALQPIMILLV